MRHNISEADPTSACPSPRNPWGIVFSAVVALSAVGTLAGCGGGGGGSDAGGSPPVSGAPAPAPAPGPAPAPPASAPVGDEPEPPPAPAPPSLPTGGDSGSPTTPALPPSLQSPTGLDISKPGKAITGITATSSALENNGDTAQKTLDGDLNTRWASAFDDKAWIQFDFGTKTPVGYMKLVWPERVWQGVRDPGLR